MTEFCNQTTILEFLSDSGVWVMSDEIWVRVMSYKYWVMKTESWLNQIGHRSSTGFYDAEKFRLYALFQAFWELFQRCPVVGWKGSWASISSWYEHSEMVRHTGLTIGISQILKDDFEEEGGDMEEEIDRFTSA